MTPQIQLTLTNMFFLKVIAVALLVYVLNSCPLLVLFTIILVTLLWAIVHLYKDEILSYVVCFAPNELDEDDIDVKEEEVPVDVKKEEVETQ